MMRHTAQHHRSRATRRGYALLLTLLLLALVATGLAGVTRLGLRRAAAAGEAVETLQRRWTLLSASATLLPLAEDVLKQNGARSKRLDSMAAVSLVLGGQPIDLVLSDEQAKVNANTMLDRLGLPDAERFVRMLVRGNGAVAQVRLSPLQASEGPGGAGAPERLFRTLDQVFPSDDPSEWLASRSPIAQVTCWGDGKLNVRRASREALRALCTPELDLRQIELLLSLRQQSPEQSIDQLLSALQPTEEQAAAARAMLTDKSVCHSLWVTVRGSRRRWDQLFVADGVAGPANLTFSW